MENVEAEICSRTQPEMSEMEENKESQEPENQDLLQDLSEQGKTAELVEMFEELPTMDVAEFMEEKPLEEVVQYLNKLDLEDQGRISSDFSLDLQLKLFLISFFCYLK